MRGMLPSFDAYDPYSNARDSQVNRFENKRNLDSYHRTRKLTDQEMEPGPPAVKVSPLTGEVMGVE